MLDGDEPARCSRRSTGRQPLLKVARRSLGRSCSRPPSRSRRVSGTSAQHRQESEPKRRQCRRLSNTRPTEKGKTSSQAKGFQFERRKRARCMNADGFGKHFDGGSPSHLVLVLLRSMLLFFWNSLPRLLLQPHCGLQGFLLTMVKSHAGSLPGTSKAGCTWPGPLPYPETFRPGAAYRVSDAHLKRLINLQLLTLDWFHLGSTPTSQGAIYASSR